MCAGSAFAQAFPSDWHYYVDVDVNTGLYARTATPVELQINFTDYLNGKTLDVNSVRVAEFTTSERNGDPAEVYSQFDQGEDFEATTNAIGEVVWILRGTATDPNTTGAVTPANTTRYYRVYFDDTDNPKLTPNYITDLVTSDLTGTYPVIENIAYKATIYRTKDTLYKLQNKLTGAMMWDATSTAWDNVGMYYSITVYNNIAVDQYYGTDLPYYSVSENKAVRVTIRSTKRVPKDGAYYNFETVRKFYSGVPYFEDETRFAPESGTNIWQWIQLRWNDHSAVKRVRVIDSTETHPVFLDSHMPLAKVYDYDAAGINGGIGHMFSSDSMLMLIAENSANRMWCAAINFTDPGFWRHKDAWTPVYVNHAVAVHNGTDQATAEAAVDKCLADYGCPVSIMVAGNGAITGKLTDASNSNRTVKGAMVRLWVDDTYIGKTYSSSVGDYTFSNVPAGTAKISVKCDGYETIVEEGITVTAGSVTTKDISVEPIIFAGKFFNLKAHAFTQTWKLIKNEDVLSVNANPAITTQAEIEAFAGPTVDPSVPMYDISVPNEEYTGWDDVQIDDKTYGWYRTIVNIPEDWAGNNLRLRDFLIDDAVEVYFNGVKLGAVGELGSSNGWHGHPCDFSI